MLRIGILGAADIAYNKFIPAANKSTNVKVVGVASNSPAKLSRFVDEYGLKVYESYEEVINSEDIDCVYIPLPPAFHYEWAKKALLCGKHVFLEKPSTTSYEKTLELVDIAKERKLVIQENYMFQYHAQIEKVKEYIASGELGCVRLYRSSFGFPRRGEGDFRYIRSLGGGTMMDNAGYTVKLATILLGESIRLNSAHLCYEENGIDIFGTAEFINDNDVSMQVSFGMDCQYQCSLEAWGSKGRLSTGRIYTAPAGLMPEAVIEQGSDKALIKLPEDDHFLKSIEAFVNATVNDECRIKMAKDMLIQSKLVEEIIKC